MMYADDATPGVASGQGVLMLLVGVQPLVE